MADLKATPIPGRIRFAPTILKRLGEELNPNVDQGLLELVKNAYDADATECHVWLDNPGPNGAVVVEDNGVGMSADDILKGWLVLGSSEKQTAHKTRLGRSPAGNKGLGRLAALRLGRTATMTSHPRGEGVSHSVVLNWDAFDEATTVDEVDVDVASEPAPDSASGTRIELSNLRGPIGRVDVRRLARALVLLADPFADEPSSFTPYLHSTEYDDLARMVQERYFDQAEYHLRASVVSGHASARVVDWRGETLWSAKHEDLRRPQGAPPYSTPDAEFDLWAFILSPRSFSTRTAQLGAVREWLQHFGGVHVYVNGLRVAPYGNSGDDWLNINLARVRSPEERPGTNTSIGRVRITDATDTLVQKTDRSGFIESEQFDELRSFAVDALEWMARRRIEAAERTRQKGRQQSQSESQESGASVKKQIESLADSQEKRDLNQAFVKYDRARERENERLRREIQLYRTLSTAGITAATFAHESNGNPLKIISIVANSLDYSLRKDLPETFASKYEQPLTRISSAVSSLSVLSHATLDLIDQDKRRVGKVPLNRTIREVVDIFAPFLEGRAVQLDLDIAGQGEPYIRGTAAALESVLTNLVNNSLSAFERVGVPKRRLRITTGVTDDVWEMAVSDNGPGIEGIALADIWLPGETQRPGGTGLGLTIVRDAVSDLGGGVEATAHGALGGATFTVRLPVLGVDDDQVA